MALACRTAGATLATNRRREPAGTESLAPIRCEHDPHPLGERHFALACNESAQAAQLKKVIWLQGHSPCMKSTSSAMMGWRHITNAAVIRNNVASTQDAVVRRGPSAPGARAAGGWLAVSEGARERSGSAKAPPVPSGL